MEKYYINQDQWQKIYEILQNTQRVRVRDENRTRRFLEGSFFIMKTGGESYLAIMENGAVSINVTKTGVVAAYGMVF